MPPDGSTTSSQTDLFPAAGSIGAASSISIPQTLPEQVNDISSPGLPGGASRAASPASRMTSTSGPAHVRASHTLSRDVGAATLTHGTFGPLFSASSPSAALQSSLENRLRRLLDVNGSPEFVLTWKAQDMPAGAPICRLAASARRTSGTGCSGAASGWSTPRACDHFQGYETMAAVSDPSSQGAWIKANRGATLTTELMAFGAWATPTARDWRSGEASEATHAKNARPLNEQMVRAAWSTPRASDGEKGGPNQAFGAGGTPLPAQMHTAAWPTPKESDHRPGMPERHQGSQSLNGRRSNLNDALTAATVRSGPTPSGSNATTAGRGVPNPAFPCWLQGYPEAWLWCAPAPKPARSAASPLGAASATRSSRRSARCSYAP